MLTGKQLRAARALLDLGVEQLAEIAGVNRDTIFNLERGVSQPREGTIKTIVRVISEHGVELTDNEGVRLKPTGVTTYDGVEAFEAFHDFLYFHLKQNGGDVALSIYDEPILASYRKDPEIHRGRMKELVGSGKVTFRILTTKSSWNTRGYIQFKYLPRQRPSPTGFYAFGDCLALMSFVKPDSPYIVMLQSGPLTEAYRQSFNILWDSAENPPSKGTDEKKRKE